MSRNQTPPADKMRERTPAEERAWANEKQVRCAKAWVGNVDHFVRTKDLECSLTPILSACATLIKLGPESDWWLVERCLETLKEHGKVVNEEANASWLKRLRAAGPQEYKRVSDREAHWETL